MIQSTIVIFKHPFDVYRSLALNANGFYEKTDYNYALAFFLHSIIGFAFVLLTALFLQAGESLFWSFSSNPAVWLHRYLPTGTMECSHDQHHALVIMPAFIFAILTRCISKLLIVYHVCFSHCGYMVETMICSTSTKRLTHILWQ